MKGRVSRIEEIKARRDIEGCAAHTTCLKADVAYLLAELQRIRDLAILFTGEADPNYKDQWETGHDAGRNAAGRQLSNLLDSMGVPK